ncbi:MAG: type II toxin-antitoxin system MqsA family antitoxin [Desulfuromonadales bacterium]|nr:type II toxin-antitoxin system MqsA family antitoxin [Desulfuromonadales bacterium]
MKCPLCGKGILVSEVREETCEYLGKSIRIAMPGEYCTICGDGIFTASETGRYLETVKAFRAQVDAEPLPPVEIKRIRKRLKLTQKQAGELLGGGIRAFSQYERGITHPGKAADTLLRLLDRHPELLEELSLKKAA